MQQTRYFTELVRRVTQRRLGLLKESGTFIFPKIGSEWLPDRRQQALCESYIVLFVAELETYIECIVSSALNLYSVGLQASIFSQAKPASEYIGAVKNKNYAWERNNNTNWSRINEFITFIGLKKTDFPGEVWDDIEKIALERGSIVHQSVGARAITDPRITIDLCTSILRNLKFFDLDMSMWLTMFEQEVVRLKENPLRFSRGMGSVEPD